MSGNYSSLNDTKKTLTNAIIGIIIIFSAWLIVDTLMKAIANGGQLAGVGMWNSIEDINCGSQVGPNRSVPLVDEAGGVRPVTPSPRCEDIGGNVERCERTIPATQPPPANSTCRPAGSGPTSSQMQVCTWTQPLGGASAGVLAEGQLTHAGAATILTTAPNVTLSSTVGPSGVSATCSTGTGCTTFVGLREQTAQQMTNIALACPTCQFVVVGGTEPGHGQGTYSHANGYKIDIDDNAAVDAFFTSTLTRDGTRTGSGGGPRYRDACGNEYVRESTHWDIGVTNGACAL